MSGAPGFLVPGQPPGHQCHWPCHPTTAVPGASSQQLELGKASVPRGWGRLLARSHGITGAQDMGSCCRHRGLEKPGCVWQGQGQARSMARAVAGLASWCPVGSSSLPGGRGLLSSCSGPSPPALPQGPCFRHRGGRGAAAPATRTPRGGLRQAAGMAPCGQCRAGGHSVPWVASWSNPIGRKDSFPEVRTGLRFVPLPVSHCHCHGTWRLGGTWLPC